MSRIEILSPEGQHGIEGAGSQRMAARLATLRGRAIALHDNAKPGSTDLLAAIGSGLQGAGATVHRWSKAHAARPSPHVQDMARRSDAAVFALGD